MILKDEIRNCILCELYKLMPDGCKPVPGVGPSDAKIMVVCEALGADEAIMEEPLVGQCGQLFNKILDGASIKREECYLSNIVHCRPIDGKKNRPPSKEEIAACKPWIFKEIVAIQPKIIVAMGKIAVCTLLAGKIRKTFTLGPICGQLYEVDYSDAKIIPTQHPSYLMQYGRLELQKTIDIFKMVKILSEEK